MLDALPRPAGRQVSPRAAAATVSTLAVAALTGYLVVRLPAAGALLVVAPIAVWLLLNRVWTVTLLGLTLPYLLDISGGAVGLNVAPSDVLLVVLVGGLLVEYAVAGRAPEVAAIAPLKLAVGQHIAVMGVLLVAHPGLTGVVNTFQRLELFVFPLLVGALVVRLGRERLVLTAFVVATTATAALWLAGITFGNKNPMGQFMADGIVVILAVKEFRRRFALAIPVLVAGVLWTQSRGSIVSVGFAFAALLLVQPGRRSRLKLSLLAVPMAVVSFVAFRFLPEEAQQRNLTFTSGNESAGEWAIKVREAYQADAWELIHAHPWTGVGVGNYLSGSGFEGTLTNDPHQVLLLMAAEGGYVYVASFLLMVGGAVWVVWRHARRAPLAPAAVAVTAAIVGHGLFDVYWVRGGPVPGWLLIGMALAQAARGGPEPDPAEPAARVETPHPSSTPEVPA